MEPNSKLALIFAIVSAAIAFVSLTFALIFKRKELKAQFEDRFFIATKAISSFIFDAYEVMSEGKFGPVDKINAADKELTENLTIFEQYGRVHKNKNIISFSVVKSKDEKINKVSFSYHFLIILANYTKFRESNIGKQVSDSQAKQLKSFHDIFWDFVNLYSKYIRRLFYNDFISCKRRLAKEKEKYEKELCLLVLDAVNKGVY